MKFFHIFIFTFLVSIFWIINQRIYYYGAIILEKMHNIECVDCSNSSSSCVCSSSNQQNEGPLSNSSRTKLIYQPKEGAPQYKCTICDHPSFQSKTMYLMHMEKLHNQISDKKHICKFCGMSFISYYMVTDHKRKSHPEQKNKNLYCLVCGLSRIKCKCQDGDRVKCPAEGCNAVMHTKYLRKHARNVHKIYKKKAGTPLQDIKRQIIEGKKLEDISSEQASPLEQSSSEKKHHGEPPKTQKSQKMFEKISSVHMEAIKAFMKDIFELRDLGFDARYLKELEESKQKIGSPL